jgi:hypothetical protein
MALTTITSLLTSPVPVCGEKANVKQQSLY